jgi:hypothetical protein
VASFVQWRLNSRIHRIGEIAHPVLRSSSSDGGSTENLLVLDLSLHPLGERIVIRSIVRERGLPAPGRLSNAPSSVATRICLSIHVSQLVSGGLRFVMAPPGYVGSRLRRVRGRCAWAGALGR